MSKEASSGVGSRSEWRDAHAREVEARATEENAERFAQALTAHVAVHIPPPSIPTGGWRGSDGVLTLDAPALESRGGSAEIIQVSDAEAGNGASQRVVVSIQAGDLGELSLVLDRSEAGVRVVIGVEDARSADAMLPEKAALLRRLEQAGLSIASVQIVRQSEVGTVLAPTARTIGSPRAPGARERAAADREEARRRGSRKLNLIG